MQCVFDKIVVSPRLPQIITGRGSPHRLRSIKAGPGLHRAFTLVEMLVVLFLIGVLAAIAVPRMANAQTLQRVNAAARRVIMDLTLAQRQARITSASKTINFNAAADKYDLPGIDHPDRAGLPYEVLLKSEPYRAAIVSADFGGDATIVFNGFGLPDSGGSVTVQVGAYTKTVVVDQQTGRASAP